MTRGARGADAPSTRLRIVSGGQSGVDRAALDAALDAGLPCGGYCPRGRWAEDGAIPARYPLVETPSAAPEERTAWNVRDTDATLVLAEGVLSGGTARTLALARERGQPLLVVDLADAEPATALRWLEQQRPARLNVAGPRESERPGIGARARRFLDALLRELAP